MEIERQAEVRLAAWLCETIEDTIKRFQFVMKEEERSVTEDEARATEERQQRSDPVIGKYANPEMYDEFVTSRRARIVQQKQAVDRLLSLLKAAQNLKRQCTEFWEEEEKSWKQEATHE